MSIYPSNGNGWQGWDDGPVMPEQPKTVATFKADSLRDGVVVPGLQAIITGGFAGLAALAVSAWLHWPYWAIGGTVIAVVSFVSWMAYRNRWSWTFERMLGLDLNRDGYIGQPQPPVYVEPEKIRVELIQNNGQRGDYIDLPVREKIPILAESVLAGRQYSQAVMVAPKKFTRPEYDLLVDALVSSGLARWKNPEAHNIGWIPTSAGKAVLKRFVKQSPALQDEDIE